MNCKMRLPGICWQLTAMICMLGPVVSSAQEPQRPKKHVLIIGMDGTREDALQKAATPNIDRLVQHGAYFGSTQILGDRYQKNDTISGPGWSSILTGVWADKHGVHDNSFKGRNYELFPHFFKHLKRVFPAAHTVSLVSWEPIHEFILSEADVSRFEPLSPGKNQIIDLKVSADKLGTNVRDGKWHHLVATRQQGVTRLYLDGKLAGKIDAAADSFPLDGGHFYLGRDTRSGEVCFNGQLDDVRIWQRALNESEIKASAGTNANNRNSRDALLAEFTFDEAANSEESKSKGQAVTALDSAGHAAGPFHALPVARTTDAKFVRTETSAAGGNGTTVLEFPDSTTKEHGLKIPINDVLRSLTEGDFTIEARFQTRAPGRHVLLGNYAPKSGSLNLELHEGNSVRVYVQPPNAQASSSLQREQERDRLMAENGAKILRDDHPDAMFVYFHQVDATGHGIGFSPEIPEYVQAIANVDGHIGTLLTALESRPDYKNEDWLVIVCTDHGGYLKGHGDGHNKPEIRNVFVVVSGPSVEAEKNPQQAYLVDVAVTALTHLTGPVDKKWQLDGKPLGLKNSK